MKLRHWSLVVALLLISYLIYLPLQKTSAMEAKPKTAKAETHSTPERLLGKDWLTISKQRKIYFIFAAEESFPKKGTPFKPVNDYISLMDRKISNSPVLQNENAEQIFHDLVMESQART